MKRSCSPLVWLCSACALMLALLTAIDPSGVYADYAAALSPGMPPIAAVFTAAHDGVYPWSAAASVRDASVSPSHPEYHMLIDTVTDAEMRSSVGNSEPFRDASVQFPQPSAMPPLNAEPKPEPIEALLPEAPDTPSFVTVDDSWFDDALFIGDSHTEGFHDYAHLDNATFFYQRGLSVWTVMQKAVVNGTQTIPQALKQQQFGKIYILLGINEIGNGTTESFAEQYAAVVDQLRELQPDALIYIQSIFHTSQRKSASSVYNNDTINERNEAISHIADDEHVFFIDNNPAFDDETGSLTKEYSGDGVHVKAPYYKLWLENLYQYGRVLSAPQADAAKKNLALEEKSA